MLRDAVPVPDAGPRVLQNDHPLDNVLLEIKSFKFAENREFVDCLLVRHARSFAHAGPLTLVRAVARHSPSWARCWSWPGATLLLGRAWPPRSRCRC